MARDHARIYVSIWDPEGDFVELTTTQQQIYFALLSSEDLTWCGIHPLLPGRLAATARDLTKSKVVSALRALAAARFIVIDDETDEILVRTFVRWDGIIKQPNVLKAAVSAWHQTRSRPIRDVIVLELGRALAEGFPEGLPDATAKALAEGFPEGFPEGFGNSLTPYPLPTGYSKRQTMSSPPAASQRRLTIGTTP